MEIQARIPAALAAVHNFIREHEPEEDNDESDDDAPIGGRVDGDEDEADRVNIGVNEPSARRDRIAHKMWAQYVQEHIDRGIPMLE